MIRAPNIERARGAWKLVEIYLRSAPIADTRRLCGEIAADLQELEIFKRPKP